MAASIGENMSYAKSVRLESIICALATLTASAS